MARRISPPLQRFLHCSSCYRSINIFHKMFIFFICIIQCRILTHYVTCVMRAGAVRSTYRTPIHTQYSMIQGVLYAYICLESRIWRRDKMIMRTTPDNLEIQSDLSSFGDENRNLKFRCWNRNLTRKPV